MLLNKVDIKDIHLFLVNHSLFAWKENDENIILYQYYIKTCKNVP